MTKYHKSLAWLNLIRVIAPKYAYYYISCLQIINLKFMELGDCTKKSDIHICVGKLLSHYSEKAAINNFLTYLCKYCSKTYLWKYIHWINIYAHKKISTNWFFSHPTVAYVRVYYTIVNLRFCWRTQYVLLVSA